MNKDPTFVSNEVVTYGTAEVYLQEGWYTISELEELVEIYNKRSEELLESMKRVE